jgi:uncharacterized membrane protein
MTNITGEATITIGRPASEAWDYVADPVNMHTWVKNIDSPGNWFDGGGPDVGSRYRIDYNYGRNTNEIIFEVTAATAGSRLSTNTVKGPYPIAVDYTFGESGDGESTELRIVMIARSDSKFTTAMFILTGWFAKSFMNKRLRSELSDLKEAIESQQPA